MSYLCSVLRVLASPNLEPGAHGQSRLGKGAHALQEVQLTSWVTHFIISFTNFLLIFLIFESALLDAEHHYDLLLPSLRLSLTPFSKPNLSVTPASAGLFVFVLITSLARLLSPSTNHLLILIPSNSTLHAITISNICVYLPLYFKVFELGREKLPLLGLPCLDCRSGRGPTFSGAW